MKIIEKIIILELPETLEEDSAKIHCNKPYQIRRTETDKEIIWWGYNTNWKFENNQWNKLIHGQFISCDTPEYEKIYQQLKNNKKL